MTRQVLVDTDVMIDFLRGYPPAVALIQEHSTRIILSSIVVAELFAGVRGDEELRRLDDFISLFRVVPLSLEMARAGGLGKRDCAQSHGVGLADAMIAATAEIEDAELMTLNTRHFPMIEGLKPAYVK